MRTQLLAFLLLMASSCLVLGSQRNVGQATVEDLSWPWRPTLTLSSYGLNLHAGGRNCHGPGMAHSTVVSAWALKPGLDHRL